SYADIDQMYGIGFIITGVPPEGSVGAKVLDLSVDINYLAKVPAKTIQALTPKTVFQQLITKINGGTVIPFHEDYLKSLDNFLLTSGDAIRGLPGSRLKTSFREFFESLDSLFSIGLGVESISGTKSIVIDQKARFYNIGAEIANIGEVSDLRVSVVRENILSALNVGYSDQTYDDVNGKYEPNLSQEWSFPVKKVANKGEQVSKYRADVYGITFTSLNLEGKTTTDSDSDNSVFVLHTVTVDGVTTLNRDFDVSSVEGFPDPAGLFNVILTPRRCLGRHAHVYASFLRGLESEYLTFQSANKNANLVVRMNAESSAIVEKENISVNSLLGLELFWPYLFTFRKEVPLDFNSVINQNLNGYITFTWMGNTYSGFIMDIGINPGKNTEYNYKLISTQINDLSTLIR
ncbi:MAG: Uncharacterized protein FD166_3740, partial [Bacteroidetes bacterium]